MRQVVRRNLFSPFVRLRSLIRNRLPFAADETLWALRDMSFEVKRGEVFGIIGSNGSGKSTLLKILSRITYPTEGVARIAGDVGSLLEVGTGFHPELTGRENIYLNGAILSMTRRDINAIFDEIVEFSGVGAFLDTPVKRYSSGMRVRLAFAVAVHFQPEILLVDEVLSVGDAEFQKRGMGKMSQVANEGRTVLLVSHNMPAIVSRCDRVMWIHKGEIVMIGDPKPVVTQYLRSNIAEVETEYSNERTYTDVPPEGPFRLRALRTLDRGGNLASQFVSSSPIGVELECSFTEPVPRLKAGFAIKNEDDIELFRSFYNDKDEIFEYHEGEGEKIVRFRTYIPEGMLNNGRHYIDPLVHVYRQDKLVTDLRGLTIDVILDIPNKNLVVKSRGGLMAPMLDWDVNEAETEEVIS